MKLPILLAAATSVAFNAKQRYPHRKCFLYNLAFSEERCSAVRREARNIYPATTLAHRFFPRRAGLF